MERRGRIRVLFCLLSASAVLAGCTPVLGSPAEPTLAATAIISDALRREAEAMAEELGISVEEAVRRASLQDLIGNLNAELEQREAATFAGLWVEQEPEYRVIVAFTHKGGDTIKKYVEGTPLAELIQVRSAKASLAELVAAEQEANRLVQELGFPFSTAVDVEGNRVELWVTDRPQFEPALKDAGRELPKNVEMIVVGEPAEKFAVVITPVPDVAFPQLRARSTMVFDLLPLQGKLLIKDGCLRVSDKKGEPGRLIIWQPDYFLNLNQGTVEILDRDGQVAARVGEQISLTLAGVNDWERQLQAPLPVQCEGPTWVMDGIVHE
jgi:hypothetical protein